jgi:hypothetical protein
MTARIARPRSRSVALRAAMVLTIAGGTLHSPPPASAQIGSLILTVSEPAAGSTVAGTIPVAASVQVAGLLIVQGVQFTLDGANLGVEDTTAPYSIPWDTKSAANGPHMLRAVARGVLGTRWTSDPVAVTVFNAQEVAFEPGDIFVSLEPGPVQWWRDGTVTMLPSTVSGLGEGMALDASRNLYVARWRADSTGTTGNTVEKFSNTGQSMGAVGSGYDCDPHTIAFDGAGITYVGQAGCNKTILRFLPGQTEPVALHPAEESQGIFWMDLAADGCTMFYTSVGPNVKRFDVCNDVQLPDFNTMPLPGAFTHDLRVLPDGGVLVSNAEVITRLDAAGVVVQTYQGLAESALWTGLDLAGDGTFWAANYYSSTVYRFDLATGDIVDSFNTDTPPNTAVAVRVVR